MDNTVTTLSFFGSVITTLAISGLKHSIQQLNQHINAYQNVKEYTPTALIQQLKISGQNNIPAFVAGELTSEKPILSRLPLIWSEKRLYDLYEYNIKKLKRVTQQGVTQLSISDYNTKIDVWRNTNLNYSHSLFHIQDKYMPKQLSILQRFTNFILKIFNQMRSEKVLLRGFSIGKLEREFGVIEGDFYVIYGEVVLDKELNKLFIQNPKHILRSKKQLIQLLRSKLYQRKIILVGLIIMFIILSYIFGVNIYKIISKLLAEREKRKLDKLRGLKYLEINNFECQICFERPRNIILKPCKHMTICHICYQRLKQQKCPVCKTNIEDKIEVFIT